MEILDNENNNITILDQNNTEINLQLYILNKLTNQGYLNLDVDVFTKSDQSAKQYFIYPSLFTYNVYKKSKQGNKIDLDNFLKTIPYQYTADDEDDVHSIFSDIEDTLELSPYAYYLLGEFIWSKKHIQYFNYTTDKRPKLNNNPFDYHL